MYISSKPFFGPLPVFTFLMTATLYSVYRYLQCASLYNVLYEAIKEIIYTESTGTDIKNHDLDTNR